MPRNKLHLTKYRRTVFSGDLGSERNGIPQFTERQSGVRFSGSVCYAVRTCDNDPNGWPVELLNVGLHVPRLWGNQTPSIRPHFWVDWSVSSSPSFNEIEKAHSSRSGVGDSRTGASLGAATRLSLVFRGAKPALSCLRAVPSVLTLANRPTGTSFALLSG